MGIYRTYFDKNNTIVQNSYVNTAKNPVSELFFGNGFSRFLLYCSFDEIKAKYNAGVFQTGTTKHYLKIKNTSNFDISQRLSLYNDIIFSNKYRAASFDLELKATKEIWDEGTGYDFQYNILNSAQDTPYRIEPSNWYQASTIKTFYNPGITLSSQITTQHFDNGDEDIVMEITDFVNGLLVSGVTSGTTSGSTGTGTSYNYTGFCLKFTDAYEEFSYGDGNARAMGLFTKYTQTFFEPFIETVYDDLIIDDRVSFTSNKQNKIYLYVNVDGQMVNLDSTPICTINNIAYPIIRQTTGTYYATILATGVTFASYKKYNDIWSNISVNGIARPNITLSFVPKDSNDYYQIGSDVTEPTNYGISISGIKHDEKVPQGDIRKIFVHLRKPYTVAEYDVLTKIYYNLYIKQGQNKINILDWQEVNKVYNSNTFTIDTTWMVPQIYYADIKVERNGAVYIYNEEMKFEVPSKIYI
jgi:hypothetical protein